MTSQLAPGASGSLADPEQEDTGWQERALCAQTDPEAFFPDKGGSTREAKRVCGSCEVRAECLEYALGHDERYGIWGGLSERERRQAAGGMTTAISPARHQSRRGDASSMPAVAAAGTARRLQALMVMRWPAEELARRLGLPAQAVRGLAAGQCPVTPGAAAAVHALYDELWDRPGPSGHTRSSALARGWAPPMAWDDDTIDDPAAVPQGIAGEAASRRNRVTAMVEDSQELLGQGYTLTQAAGRLGVSPNTLERARLRRGLRLAARRHVA